MSDNKIAKDLVACKNAWFGCNKFIHHEDVNYHMENDCLFRKVLCTNNCGKFIYLCKLDEHIINHCKKRFISCYKCNQSILSEHSAYHLQNLCLERMLKCSVSCGIMLKAKDAEKHENEVCIQKCKFNCGMRIGPAAKLVLHQLFQCSLRLLKCPIDGCFTDIPSKNFDEHVSILCPELLVLCSNGCGLRIKKKDLFVHNDEWRGSCTERFINCPKTLIGRRIQILHNKTLGLVLNFRRRICDGNIVVNTRNVIDEIYVKFEHGHDWLSVWDTQFEVLDKQKISTCKSMIATELDEHLQYSCMESKMKK